MTCPACGQEECQDLAQAARHQAADEAGAL